MEKYNLKYSFKLCPWTDRQTDPTLGEEGGQGKEHIGCVDKNAKITLCCPILSLQRGYTVFGALQGNVPPCTHPHVCSNHTLPYLIYLLQYNQFLDVINCVI